MERLYRSYKEKRQMNVDKQLVTLLFGYIMNFGDVEELRDYIRIVTYNQCKLKENGQVCDVCQSAIQFVEEKIAKGGFGLENCGMNREVGGNSN
jgi:hypothetical protein